MNQLFDTQLQVVQRALGDVIAPALGDAESYVVEQLQLSIATLAFMQQRLPHARGYHRATLASYLAMAEDIVSLLARFDRDGSGLDAPIVRGRAVLADPAADLDDYRDVTGELRGSIAALAAEPQPGDCGRALDALILDRSGPLLVQDRIWCIPMGFELRPEDLPPPAWNG